MEDYKQIKVYECNHCKEKFSHEDYVKLHQDECTMNAKNASCVRCDNLNMIYDYKEGLPVVGYFCKHKKTMLAQDDVNLMDADCFVKREEQEVVKVQTEAFKEYMEKRK